MREISSSNAQQVARTVAPLRPVLAPPSSITSKGIPFPSDF